MRCCYNRASAERTEKENEEGELKRAVLFGHGGITGKRKKMESKNIDSQSQTRDSIPGRRLFRLPPACEMAEIQGGEHLSI